MRTLTVGHSCGNSPILRETAYCHAKKKVIYSEGMGRHRLLDPGVRLPRRQALKMVKRRAKRAGLTDGVSNHTFRATGITADLQNGGTVENAQRIAAHESRRSTKLYDRTSDEINLGEIEKLNV